LNSYLNDEHKPITLGIEAISKLILAICLVLFVSDVEQLSQLLPSECRFSK